MANLDYEVTIKDKARLEDSLPRSNRNISNQDKIISDLAENIQANGLKSIRNLSLFFLLSGKKRSSFVPETRKSSEVFIKAQALTHQPMLAVTCTNRDLLRAHT